MKKPSRKKAAAKNKKRFTVRQIFIALLAFVVFFFIFNHIRHKFLAYQERQKFDASEKQINILSDRIIAEFGEPITKELKKSCSYASAKYGRGPLGCGVSRELLYKVDGYSDAESLVYKIDAFLEKQDNLLSHGSKLYLYGPADRFISLDKVQKNTATNGFRFVDSNTFGPSIQYDHYAYTKNDEVVMINIHSGGPAIAEHFPVDN